MERFEDFAIPSKFNISNTVVAEVRVEKTPDGQSGATVIPKIEVEESSASDAAVFTVYRQPLSADTLTRSDDEFVITYSGDHDGAGVSREQGSPGSSRKIKEKTVHSTSSAATLTTSKAVNMKTALDDKMFDDDSEPEPDGGFTTVVSVLQAAEGEGGTAECGSGVDSATPAVIVKVQPQGKEIGHLEGQQDPDEIEVVEEGAGDFQDGELIKEYIQSRHGTNSATFLSQMRFFGGRTWARGRGKGRGRGRGKYATNIALKLIESDKQDEAAAGVANMQEMVGRGKKSYKKPASRRGYRRETRTSDKNLDSAAFKLKRLSQRSSFKSRRGSRAAFGVEKPGRGRGRGLKGRGVFNRCKRSRGRGGIGRGRSKTVEAVNFNAEPVEEYESNDEDTLAAIKASLEELKKQAGEDNDGLETSEDNNSTRTSTDIKEDVKQSNTAGASKKRGRPLKSQTIKSDRWADEEATASLAKRARGRLRSSPTSVGKLDDASASSDNSDKECPSVSARTSYLNRLVRSKKPRRGNVRNISHLRRANWKSRKSLKSEMTGQSDEDEALNSARQRLRAPSGKFRKCSGKFRKCSGKDNGLIDVKNNRCSSVLGVLNQRAVASTSQQDNSDDGSQVSEEKKRKIGRPRKHKVMPKIHSSSAAVVQEESSDSDDEVLNRKSPVSKASTRSSPSESTNRSPVVKLTKLNPDSEDSLSWNSSASRTLASRSKRLHDRDNLHYANVTSLSANPGKVSRKSLSGQPSSSGYSSNRLVSNMTSADISSKIKPQGENLTKSVERMMSCLFGDNLAQECPDGFMVNVRLEVEKKNERTTKPDGQVLCCKSKKPELCPCLQRVSEKKLAAVLKEKIEQRRDLTVATRSTLLASLINFMQEWETASGCSS